MEKNWRKQRKRDRNCFPRDGSVWVGWHRHETKRHKEQQRYQADEFLVEFLSFLSDKFPRIDEVVWCNNGGSQETLRSSSEQLWKQNYGDPSFAFEIIDFECVILTTSCGIFSILTCRFVRRSERYILVQTPSGIFRFFGFLSRSDSCHALMVLFLDFPWCCSRTCVTGYHNNSYSHRALRLSERSHATSQLQ